MKQDFTVGTFSGPLDKLLELVEERKLEVSEISLAQVTNDFLKYLKTLEKIETPVLADFIVIASRLILIKSKSLLPNLSLTEEEEGEIKELEERLKAYRELKPAMKLLARLWNEGKPQVGRPYLLRSGWTFADNIGGEKLFYPSSNLDARGLAQSLTKIFAGFQKLERESDTIKETIVSIEENIQEIVARLQRGGETSFSGLSQAKPRSEVIAIFLAILHLAREQMIFLEQKHYFSDIMIRSPGK